MLQEKKAEGRRLACFRKRARLNQERVAELLEISRGAVAHIERGHLRFTHKLCGRLTEALSERGRLKPLIPLAKAILEGKDRFQAVLDLTEPPFSWPTTRRARAQRYFRKLRRLGRGPCRFIDSDE